MKRDIWGSASYKEIKALYEASRRPGCGAISDGTELSVAPGGSHAVFTASIVEELEGVPPTRICRVDLSSGEQRVLTSGPGADRLARYSPNGQQIAYLSDRETRGVFQLYLLDVATGSARLAVSIEGSVEDLRWSPNGKRILLRVVSRCVERTTLPWLPVVEVAGQCDLRRRALVLDLSTGRLSDVSGPALNVWEAAWCGDGAVAAVASEGAREGHWYGARLVLMAQGCEPRSVHVPRYQLGSLAGSADGRLLAFVAGLCSDRALVSGDLHLMSVDNSEIKRLDTSGVDVTCVEWRSDTQILIAGHRGLETVVGLCDVRRERFVQVWASTELSTSSVYASVAGCGSPDECAFISEGFMQAPALAVIRDGTCREVGSIAQRESSAVAVLGSTEQVAWSASDGPAMEGWLLRPKQTGPHPLIMNVHGGPVYHWRSHWMGRRSAHLHALLARGYAIFFPNPRGSSARGQEFARRVLGDLGGADTRDLLSGLDHLIERGIADPRRLGVTGASYGGYMSAWLITQDSRFAAAVPVCPATNRVSQHLLSEYPQFVSLFLADHFTNTGGRYSSRSPIMHAHKARTATLNICGALDQCTPAVEAAQFHHALEEQGVESVLVTYPEEGHGIRSFPAVIDFGARMVDWFVRHA